MRDFRVTTIFDGATKIDSIYPARVYHAHLIKRMKALYTGRLMQILFLTELSRSKPTVTDYEVEVYESEKNTSTVRVSIRTGRYHLIRRHFEQIGHPVMGDPRYGRGNINTDGMKLKAMALQFRCPFKRRTINFDLKQSA